MPVIVVGADTKAGEVILEALQTPEREIRTFVTDEPTADDLRRRGFKVALGDVSDASHVEGAATRCFTAVLIVEAAHDKRERSFAETADDVLRGWARAVASSEVTRVIWVTDDTPPRSAVEETVTVDPRRPDLGQHVCELDDVSRIT